MIKWVAGARISPVSSCQHSLHYHTEQTHACVESQIPANDISRGTEERWLHPTYIHPTQACLLPTNYTNMHTQLHYRWIHTIVKVTAQEALLLYAIQKYTIIRCTWFFSNDASLRVLEPKTTHDCTSSKWPPDDWERNFSQAFAQA